MHGADAGAAQLQLQPEVEVRRVDADEDVGAREYQVADQVLAPAQQLAQAAEDLDQAHDRQALHGEFGNQALGLHARTAHADELDLGVAFAQRLHQAGAKDVPRGLARHQGDAQLAGARRHGQRVMPRVALWMESQNTATSGNCAADSASSASASSTVRPWRYTTL